MQARTDDRLRIACVEIAEKVQKAKTMARIYLYDNYEYQEVAEPLRDALELLGKLCDCAPIELYGK